MSTTEQALYQTPSRPLYQHIAIILALSATFFICRLEFYLPITADDLFFGYFKEPLHNLAVANRVNGRFASGAFVHAFEMLNEEYFVFLYVCKVLTVILFATFAYVFCHLITGGASAAALTIASLIIILHPYNTTNFDNIINQPNMLLSISATLLAIWAFAKTSSYLRFALCFSLLLIVASSYQTVAYYFFVFVVAFTLFQAKSEQEITKALVLGAAISALALVVYFALHKMLLPDALASVKETGEPLMVQTFLNHRSDLRPPTEILESILQYGDQLVRSFAAPEPIFMTGPKVFVAIALGLPILLWLYREFREGTLLTPLTRWRVYLLLLLLLMCGSVIHIALQQTRIAPRSMMQASTVMAVFFLFGYIKSQAQWRTPILGVGGAVAILVGWLTIDIALNRQRILQRDTDALQQIVKKLSTFPGYPDQTRIAVVGWMLEDAEYLADIPNYFDINPSKFSTPWSIIPMLSGMAGKRLEPVPRDGKIEAQRTCLSHYPLQEPYLLIQEGADAILCLQYIEYHSPHY